MGLDRAADAAADCSCRAGRGKIGFEQVFSLTVLGDVVTADGGTTASWTGKGATSTRNFEQSRRLSFSRGVVLARVQALLGSRLALEDYAQIYCSKRRSLLSLSFASLLSVPLCSVHGYEGVDTSI